MTQAIKQFLEADALRTQGEWEQYAFGHYVTCWGDTVAEVRKRQEDATFIAAASCIAHDLAKMVEDMRVAKEALDMAKRALAILGSEIPNLKAVRSEHDPRLATPANYAAELAESAKDLIEPAITRLKPYENLFEKERER